MKVLIVKQGYENRCNLRKYDKVFTTDKYTLSAYQVKQIVSDKVRELNMVGVLPSRVEFIKDEYSDDTLYITRSIVSSKYTQQIDVLDKLIMIKEFKDISDNVYYLHDNKRVELKMNIKLGAEYNVTNVHTQMSMEIGYSELRKIVKSLTPTKEADDDNHTYFGHDAKMIGDYNPIKLTVNYYNMYKFKQWSTIDEKYILLYKGKSPVIAFGGDRIIPNKVLSVDGNTARYKLTSSTNNIQVSHKTNWRWNTNNKEDDEELDYFIDGIHCVMSIKVMKAIKTLFQITGRVDASELHQIAITGNYFIQTYKYNYNSLDKVINAHHTLVNWLNTYNINPSYGFIQFEHHPSADVFYEDSYNEDNEKYITDYDYNHDVIYMDIDINDVFNTDIEDSAFALITVLL